MLIQVTVNADQWDALRKACEIPHDHYDGQNECSICDEPLVIAATNTIAALRHDLERQVQLNTDLVNELEKLKGIIYLTPS